MRMIDLSRALALIACSAAPLAAQATPAAPKAPAPPPAPAAPALSADQRAALIKSALSAAPANIAEHAAVMTMTPDGKMVQLREGTNGFTCFPDDPSTPGPDPACADAEAMKWFDSYMAHAPKAANTAPGIVYMLAGGSDPSNTDPYAKPGPDTKWVNTPPHWMILWPFDPATSGIPATPKTSGTFIMFAGTPWAHLMVVGAP